MGSLPVGDGPSLATWACHPLPASRCCHAHDCCYQKLFDLGCHPYVDHYEYTIENNTSIVCSEFSPCLGPLPTEEKGLDGQPPPLTPPWAGAVHGVAR